MRSLPTTLIALALPMPVLTACGETDAPPRDDVASEAEALAEETQEIQRDVSETARSLVEDPYAREDALDRLEDQERRAQELTARVDEELPDDDPVQRALREANERTTEATRELRDFAEATDEGALDEAREELNNAERSLDEAVDELLARAPEDARERLEELREQVPANPLSE